MCLSFRNVGSKYRFPIRQQLQDSYMPAHFKAHKDNLNAVLAADCEIFGLALCGDGATVKRMPLLNIVGMGAHEHAGLLQIVVCTKHMAAGGTKNAEYIAGL